MICPNCGTIDDEVELDNNHNRNRTVLSICPNCDNEVLSGGTKRSAEPTKLATVREGQEKEDKYAQFLLDKLGGDIIEDRGQFADIDKNVYDIDGNLLYALEIKTRTCTMNGYLETKFPYRKIEEAKKITEEHNIPVHIVIVFTDGIGKLTVSNENNESYSKGENNFVPNYREETSQTQQIPVKYNVENLDVIPTN